MVVRQLLSHWLEFRVWFRVLLSREARQQLKAYLEWRQQQGGVFEPLPESPMFLCQNPKHQGQRLGAIAGVEDLHPHRFRHSFGTEVTRCGVDPLFGKELMGIKSDWVFQRYTQGVFKQARFRRVWRRSAKLAAMIEEQLLIPVESNNL